MYSNVEARAKQEILAQNRMHVHAEGRLGVTADPRTKYRNLPTRRSAATGNNTYKAVQQSTGAIAMGPVMQVWRAGCGPNVKA